MRPLHLFLCEQFNDGWLSMSHGDVQGIVALGRHTECKLGNLLRYQSGQLQPAIPGRCDRSCDQCECLLLYRVCWLLVSTHGTEAARPNMAR